MPSDEPRIVPVRMAHFVVRTRKFGETVAWYKTVFQAHATFENDRIAFLRFDAEHHRIVVGSLPDLVVGPDNAEGIDHVAWTYASIDDLLSTYSRLTAAGIVPVRCINHGPTTSFYYADPVANGVELMVDNFDDPEDCVAWFSTKEFKANPVGTRFDPELLLQRHRAGAPWRELARQGALPELRDPKKERFLAS